jgi:hypothetical protein
MSDQSLKNELASLIVKECVRLGYSKHAKLIFSKALGGDSLGVLAFGFGFDNGLFIDPSAGIMNRPIELTLAELTGKKVKQYSPLTLGALLGHVPPLHDVLWYRIQAGETPEREVDRMMGAITTFAVPWIDRHTNLDAFIQDLSTGVGTIKQHSRLRLPVAYYLKKDFETTRRLLIDGLHELGSSVTGPVTTEYREFAERLLARLPQGH